MSTKTGQWPLIAAESKATLLRYRGYTAIRYLRLTSTGNITNPPDFERFVEQNQKRFLDRVCAPARNLDPIFLEQAGEGLIRILRMAGHDPLFAHLLKISWHSAIEIARWNVIDPAGSIIETRRYLNGDNDTGPNATRRRHRSAIQNHPDYDLETGRLRKGRSRNLPPHHRLRLEDFLVDEGRSAEAVVTSFSLSGHGGLALDILSSNIPDLLIGNRISPTGWANIVRVFSNHPGSSTAASGIAAACLRLNLTDSAFIRKALEEIRLSQETNIKASHYASFLRSNLYPNKPPGKVVSNVEKYRRMNPVYRKWSLLTCANTGLYISRRDFSKWERLINQYGDPENHPLNFLVWLRTNLRTTLMD